MRLLILAVLLPLFALPAAAAAQSDVSAAALARIDEAGLRAHLAYLASDQLEGRAPGAPGGVSAARYIAGAFQRAGALPLADGYFQQVPLVGVTALGQGTLLRVQVPRGQPLTGRRGADYVAWGGAPQPLLEDSAPLVFVGYGVRAPEYRWDDYEGVDVAGRIVVVLVGDPPASFAEPTRFEGEELTYYGRWTYKLEEAERQGAAGVLLVHRSEAAGYGWDVVAASFGGERLALDGDARPAPLRAWLAEPFARRVLAAAGHDLDDLTARAARRGFRPVPLSATARLRIASEVRRLQSPNVAAIVRGSDPARRDEVVVFTAHYDHLGVGPAVGGDSIYNGAYDNAGGVAILLELAEAFAAMNPAPPRSMVFLATTGEEAGLLGARWYAEHEPLLPLGSTATVINFDGANLWGPTEDIGASGAEGTPLHALAETRARSLGFRLSPPAAPGRGYRFRTDRFVFERAGVPALDVEHGVEFRGRPPAWGAEMLATWDDLHYHRPSDELAPTANLGGAVQQARFGFLLGLDVARLPAAASLRTPAGAAGSPNRSRARF